MKDLSARKKGSNIKIDPKEEKMLDEGYLKMYNEGRIDKAPDHEDVLERIKHYEGENQSGVRKGA